MARLTFQSSHLIMGLSFGLWLTFVPVVFAELSMNEQTIMVLSQKEGTGQISSFSNCLKGNGKAVTETRSLPDFSMIKIDGIFTVTIELQQQKAVTVKGDENLLPRFATKVEDGTLVVSADGSICPKVSPEIQITNDILDRLSANGATDIHISNLKNKTFTVHLDGSSDLKISGETEKFTGLLEGSNELLAGDLQSQESTVTIDGAGDAVLNVSKKLIAEINGAGDILYIGNPSIIEKRINGAGDIEPQ